MIFDDSPFRNFVGSIATVTGTGVLGPGEVDIEAIANSFLLWLHSLVRSPVFVSGDTVYGFAFTWNKDTHPIINLMHLHDDYTNSILNPRQQLPLCMLCKKYSDHEYYTFIGRWLSIGTVTRNRLHYKIIYF